MRNIMMALVVVCAGLMQGCCGSSDASASTVKEGDALQEIVTQLSPEYTMAVEYLRSVELPQSQLGWNSAIVVKQVEGAGWHSFAFVTSNGLYRSSSYSSQGDSCEIAALLDVGDHVLLWPRSEFSNSNVWHLSVKSIRIIKKFAFIPKPQ